MRPERFELPTTWFEATTIDVTIDLKCQKAGVRCIQRPTKHNDSILKLQVESVIAISEGKSELAIKLARQAAEMQASMPFRYGPPRISKPTSELLADHLLELGHYKEASEEYADQLSRSQLRTNSLIGLARASSRIGDETTAREIYDSLSKIWHSADQELPMHIEVAEFEGR